MYTEYSATAEAMSRLEAQGRSLKSAGRQPSPSRRAYRMRRRAEHMQDTRQRITEAAMKLHTSVGPSQASIAAIADEAGVTRLTVYRHFGDAEEMFAACMGHWASLHPGPDPSAWRAVPDLGVRARRALSELYAWYADAGHELLPIHRDVAYVPPEARARIADAGAEPVNAIAGSDGSDLTPRGRRIRAIAAHLTRLETWQSLVVEQGLTTEEAVDAGVSWLKVAGANSWRR